MQLAKKILKNETAKKILKNETATQGLTTMLDVLTVRPQDGILLQHFYLINPICTYK